MDYLALNQLVIKGYLNGEDYKLLFFTMTALSVWGKECFFETSEEIIFAKDKCFYGNV